MEIKFERNPIFDIACGIRPIKAFHPATLLQPDPDSCRLFLNVDAKVIWFYQYCAENNIQGKIECVFTDSKELKDIASPEYAGGVECVFKEFWTATIYMNGEVVSTATSSGTYAVNDRKERDDASNTLRKYAISAALMQAGFGTISAFNMSENDKAMLNASGMQCAATPSMAPGSPMEIQECFYGNTQPAPFNPPAAPVIQDTFFGSAPETQSPVQNSQIPVFNASVAPGPFGNQQAAPNQFQTPPPAPVVPPVDPIAAAKQLVWVGSGRFKGKTLGEILSDPSGLKNIAYIANDFTPRTEEMKQVKEAAKLILEHEQNK